MCIALGLALASAGASDAEDAEAAGQGSPVTASGAQGANLNVVALPVPLSNPALGTGLVLTGLALYRPFGSVEPWSSALGVLYTNTHSWPSARSRRRISTMTPSSRTSTPGTGTST